MSEIGENTIILDKDSVLELRVLHLLCLGSKATQAKDIRHAESVMDALRKESGV